MTDQNPADSGLQAGAPDANQTASAPAGVQPNSQTPEQVPAWAKQLISDVRGLQGDKDRGVAGVRKQLDEYKPILDAVKTKMSGGMDFDAAVREVQIDSLLAASQTPSAPAPQGSANGNSAVDDGVALGLLQKFGLQTSDTQVQQALLNNRGDLAGLAVALVEIRDNRKNQPAPSAASIMPTTNGNPAPQKTPEQLVSDYKQEMLANRGNKAALQAVRVKHAALGVPVHEVDFT